MLPLWVSASHSGKIDTSDLDDEVVEEISLPVLFGVAYEQVVPDFGAPRGGGTRSHLGQDMVVPKGTPIVSPTEAVVLSIGVGPSSGKYIYTANPGGETYRYMHLDEVADLNPGDELSVGDYIGTVGDTGNAPDGVYNLHFEIVTEDKEYIDPYTRLNGDFSLKEKMRFTARLLREVDDEEEYAEFLVTTFPSEFRQAAAAKYDLPDEIEEALEDSGVFVEGETLTQIKKLLSVVPQILTTDLSVGDSGPQVQLLQLYLLFYSSGPAREDLGDATATGYFGSITQAALLEYQRNEGISETGVYDSATRKQMNT